MKDQITAKVYANAFMEIANEKKIDLAQEMTSLTEVINSSNDLENVLFLDVFSNEDKKLVFADISAKIKLSQVVVESINFIIDERRISILPLIFKEVIVLDDDKKGFLRGTIEGSSDSISDEDKAKLISEIKKYISGKEMVFEYKKNEELTAGYRATINDMQLDASVDKQLEDFKSSILGE